MATTQRSAKTVRTIANRLPHEGHGIRGALHRSLIGWWQHLTALLHADHRDA